MSFTQESVLASARSCIRTPYHHGGRVKGLQGGMDCSGLLVVVARDCGLTVTEDENYSYRGDNYSRMVATIKVYADELQGGEQLQPGDILVFRKGTMLNHCGIYTGDGTFVHSAAPLGCREQNYDDRWQDVTTLKLRYRGMN